MQLEFSNHSKDVVASKSKSPMIKQPKELPEHVDPKVEKIDKSTVEGIYAKQARLRKEQDEAW